MNEHEGIKGLAESLGEQGKIDVDRFLSMQVRTAHLLMHVISNGGNIHGVDVDATRKRRAANKVARKQRRVNR